MNDDDKAGRYLIKRDPSRIVGWLLHRPAGVPFSAWLDARRLALPDQGDLAHDLVAACGADGGLEGFCIELQARSSPDATRWVLCGHVPRLVAEPGGSPLSAVGGVVVNFTGPAQADGITQVPTLAPDCRLEGRVIQRTFRDESALELATIVLAGEASIWLLGWLPLMHGGAEAGMLASWRSAVMRWPDERERGIVAGLTLTFATLARNRPAWERGLEGFNVIKSPYLEELREAVRLDALAEGRAEGEAKGRATALHEVIVALGRQRFGKAASQKQRAELDALTDLPRLERMRDRLLTATSWSDLLATP
jgi:hypothetical protein